MLELVCIHGILLLWNETTCPTPHPWNGSFFPIQFQSIGDPISTIGGMSAGDTTSTCI